MPSWTADFRLARYHPDSTSVGALLGNGIGFPDLSLYSDRPDLWLEFFEELGMARTPRATDIINVIDAIMALAEPDEQKANRISNIAEYVDQHWIELKEQELVPSESQPTRATPLRMAEALASRAWLPVVTIAPRDYPPQFLASKTSSFFRPAEMLQRTSLHLAGSVRPICRIARLFQLPADIPLKATPELEDVLAHFENALLAVATIDGPLNERFRMVFRRIYSFLGSKFADLQEEALKADARVSDIRLRFAHKKCLLDSEGRTWLPKQCFAEPIPGFLGHRARVRADDNDIDRGLRVLGRRDRPEASDYITFFKELNTAQSGVPVPDTDRILLRTAYHAAASLNNEDNFHECPVLLESGLLAEAGVAVVDDAPWLSERARGARMLFLDPGLGESVAMVFGVRLLSSAVYENPLEDQPSEDSIFQHKCAELETNLRSPQLCAGIHRLLRNADTEVRIEELRRFLAGLGVIPVSKLSTVLVWADGNVPVEGSQGSSDVVFDHDRNAIVVSEETDEVLYDRVGSILSNELCLDGHDLGDSTAYLVAILRVSPDSIDRHLTKLRVRSLTTASVGIADSEPDDDDGFIDAGEEVSDYETSSPANSLGIEVPVEREPVQGASAPRLVQPGTVPVSQRDDGNGSDHDSYLPSDTKGDVKAPSSSAIEPEEASSSLTQLQKPLSLEDGVPGHTGKSGAREHQKQEPGSTPPLHAMPVRTDSEPIRDTPISHQGKLRSDQAGAQRGRARTYVTHHANSQAEEPPAQRQRRQRVDQAAVKRVMQFEVERGRQPKEMPYENEGYDIESYLPNGHLDRFIEVKGSSGTWADFGVALSRSQFRKASMEGNSFWLYVVEFAMEPNRSRVYAIQSPAESVDEYWFDGGWRDVAKERGTPSIEAALKICSTIILDGARIAAVKDILKRGALMLLDIQFEDNSSGHVVYSPRRVRVLQELQEEETAETTQ